MEEPREKEEQETAQVATEPGDGAPEVAAPEEPLDSFVNQRGREVPLKAYDFSQPIQMSRGFERSLTLVAESYAKLVTLSLSSLLRIPVTVRSAGVRQVLFDEFTRELPNPSCINILGLAPLKVPAIMELDLSLSFLMLEKLLGSHTLAADTKREFTSIESRIARKVINRMIGDFQEAMGRLLDLDVSLKSIEHNPDFTWIMNANDPCIVQDFEIEVAESVGKIKVCISLSSIDAELVQDGMTQLRDLRTEQERTQDFRRLGTVLDSTQTDVVVEIGRVSAELKDVQNLSVGQVLNLRKQVGSDLLVRIGDSPVFYGQMGRFNRKSAIKITQVLDRQVGEQGDSRHQEGER